MMAVDMITSASSAPATESLTQAVDAILELVAAANDVLVKKESFRQLASYLERVVPVLRELSKRNFEDSAAVRNVVEILGRETKAAKQLTLDCSKKSKVYLLVNCRNIVNRIELALREISSALNLLPLANLDLSSSLVHVIENLCVSMSGAEFKSAVAEEAIMEKIETGIQERNVDRSYANNLLILIAEAVGISTEESELKKEIEEFKSEIENARLRKDLAEAIQMDQIIALLERADAASSPKEKETRYYSKRRSLGNQPLEPLESFCCPITRDVMVDPVETSSGQTFERSAIEKWLLDGNTLCPLTMTPIDKAVLRPNKTLRQSIEEWKDRNTMITIGTMKQKLVIEEDEEVITRLSELHDLCEQRDLHREWVILEDYIQVLIQLLDLRNREIRKLVLVILCILVKDNDNAKERTMRIDKAIERIVKSLGRRPDEQKLAVALLLELSKHKSLRNYIGKVQGCILLLVTMSNSDDNKASSDAHELLAKLSYCDENVVQMAKANYFRHLLVCLSSGSEEVRSSMAESLAEMELTSHSKEALLEGGALAPLLELASQEDIDTKRSALRALKNLSTIPKNGLRMIREGADRPLLDMLFHPGGAYSSLLETLAAIIVHLAASMESQDSGENPVPFLESEEDVFRLFSLVSLKGPEVQQSIIRTFYILCGSNVSTNIKSKLMQSSAMPVLIQLCENDNPSVRANAVKLLCSLTEGSDEAIVNEHVTQSFIETLLRIIRSPVDDEEIVFAVGIVNNLPETPLITQWLIEAKTLSVVVGFLGLSRTSGTIRNQLTENAVGAVRRFAAPTDVNLQKSLAEANAIPMLVQLLETGTALTKRRAAETLARLSQSSLQLCMVVPKRKGLWCFSSSHEPCCLVHGGICSVASSFCLVEADAVRPLVKILDELNSDAAEAALEALLTLIEGGDTLHGGSTVLSNNDAIKPIVKLLGSASLGLQEKALRALERIFQILEFKQKYGGLAQMPLVDLTQRGTSGIRSKAARILAHLNLIHDQSSFF